MRILISAALMCVSYRDLYVGIYVRTHSHRHITHNERKRDVCVYVCIIHINIFD